MATIKVGENESVESALKRFKRRVQKDDIIKDIRKHEEYVRPSVKKKLKKIQAIKNKRKKDRR